MKVLVFEADSEFASVLQDGLARIGCQTTVVDDANVGLQAAASEKPDLILLSIELPRMNGFSVCNKLKRDPALKDVPLIIMSSDSTEETFEQHRRLRTRAEDYVHKPISFPELMNRAKAFVSLPDVEMTDPPPSSDIVIDDEIVLEDADPISMQDAEADNEPTSMMQNPLESQNLEGEVSAFADSAFSAMQVRPPAPRRGGSVPDREPEIPPPPKPPSSEPPVEPAKGKSEPAPGKTTSMPPPPPRRPKDSIPPRPSSGDGGSYQVEIERHRTRANDLEVELRNVKERLAAFEDSSKLDALKDVEVQRLKRDLDEAKAKLASSSKGGSSAREFLDLREQLNKKDKELLELREQVTAKERELLGLRDQSLGFERQKADLDDKILELENQIYEAQRTIESLRADKDQANKRGEDFKRKGEKLQTELDIRTHELEDATEAHSKENASRDAREAEMRADNAAALEQAEAKRQADVAAAEQQGRENLALAVDAARQEAGEDKARALSEAAAQAAEDKDEALAGKESELRKEFDSRLAALHRANEDAMNKLKAEHSQNMQEAEEASAKRLADREEELQTELASTRQALAEVRQAKEEGEASRDARIAALTADLQERTEERDSARDTISARDGRIAALEEDLAREKGEHSTARDTIAARDFSIAGLEDNLAKARDELAQTKQTLETQSARLEKARGKWDNDRSSLERTKDALASALAQIEEAENRPFD